MALVMLGLLLLSSAALLLTRRDRETCLIFALNAVLTEFWLIMLIYIAKKGGIAVEMQTLLFGTRAIRVWLQYRMFTLGRLGYLLAVGRYLFPPLLVLLAMQYSRRPLLRSQYWLLAALFLLPVLSLVAYIPQVFDWLLSLRRDMARILAWITLCWILLYLLLALVLLARDFFSIRIAFYRKRFAGRAAMLISLAILYLLYAPQDPGQIYLFYRDEYMGAVQGLWYLFPALNITNYIIVFIIVISSTVIGVTIQLGYVQDNLREGQEDVAIRRKFDAASKGASVFVHSVKNQLLANRVLLKRMDTVLSSDQPNIELLRDYQRQLVQNNTYMIGRMEELYKGIRTNSITLVPERLEEICGLSVERLQKKYPSAQVMIRGAEGVMILCDRNHLSEALYNVLLNGWEAQLQDEDRIQPLEILVSQERMWTLLEISDHGHGIPKAQLRHIFEPFWSSKNTNLNWGMGLYYVRQIIRSHLGILRIDTQLGQGTTFLIQLPRYDGRTIPEQETRRE